MSRINNFEYGVIGFDLEPLPKVRPHFEDSQILSPGEIVPGMIVEAVHKDRRSGKTDAHPLGVIAIGKRIDRSMQFPLMDGHTQGSIVEDPNSVIFAEQIYDGRVVPSSRYLSDLGVLPYEADKGEFVWNDVNYLRHSAE